MKLRFLTSLATAAFLATSFSACASFDPGKLASAINQADSGPCYKDIDVTVTPMLLFGWYVPIISGSFKKTCNPEKAPGAQVPPGNLPAPLQPNTLIVPLGAKPAQ